MLVIGHGNDDRVGLNNIVISIVLFMIGYAGNLEPEI